MQNSKPAKVIFFGDSITEVGVQPGGYIDHMRKRLKEKYPTSSFQLTGAGISGNKVYDLYLRLEEDVLNQKPDWVFIYVGVNDVWHKKSSSPSRTAGLLVFWALNSCAATSIPKSSLLPSCHSTPLQPCAPQKESSPCLTLSVCSVFPVLIFLLATRPHCVGGNDEASTYSECDLTDGICAAAYSY
jgi:hypothetical protein